MAKRKIEELGSVSEETAKKPEEFGIEELVLNHYLAKMRGVKRTENGKHYVECACAMRHAVVWFILSVRERKNGG